MEGSKKRHLFKTITWRITATLTTMIIAWIVSGDPMTGLTVGGIEFFVKMPVYYLHERAWYKSNFGISLKAIIAKPGSGIKVVKN